MAITTFIEINPDTWTEISTTETSAYISNAKSDHALYVIAESLPPASQKNGHRIAPHEVVTYSVEAGSKIFARSFLTDGLIAISPGAVFSKGGGGQSDVVITGPLTAFNEVSIAELTPITQITAQYGLLDNTEEFTILSGTTRAEDSKFVASSGTNAGGQAAILTRREITYRAGQGMLARLTALFDVGVVGNVQEAGFINNTDRLGFGYNEATFGIVYKHGGESEIQELTITTPAAGAENATITIDGTPFTVPLTAGTVQHNAFEIAESLNVQVVTFDFSSNDDQVVARSVLFGNGLSFAFVSATAVAAWSQVQAGLTPINDFIPQASWNADTRPDLNPQNGNVYQIQFQYLGFGAIEFFIEDENTARLILVHRIQFANTSTLVSVRNPSFRVGWTTSNVGNTTNIEIAGASAGSFIEGPNLITVPNRAARNTNPNINSSVETNILTLRNRIVLGSRRNRAEIIGVALSVTSDSNQVTFINIRIGATIAGDQIFSYIDKDDSIAEIMTDPGEVSGGRLVGSFVISPNSFALISLRDVGAILFPGNTLTIPGLVSGGAASTVSASLIWQEDL